MTARPKRVGPRAQRWEIVGIALWRGGLAFTAGYLFYQGAWQIVRRLDWPPQITVGSAIALAGFGLFMLSLIAERRQAARAEGNLLDDGRYFDD